jgi:AraC-like DNA-binding protein
VKRWITAIAAEALARAVAAAGGDARGVRAALGVSDAVQFEERIAVDALVDAWERAIAETGRRDLAVLAAPRGGHDERSLLTFCAANQATVGEALAIADRYYVTVSDAYAWRVIDDDAHVRLRVEPLGPIAREGWQAYLEFESIDLVTAAQRLTRGRAVPSAVRYVHDSPAADAIARALRVPVEWGADACEIVFPRAVRTLAIDGARPQLAAMLEARLAALVANVSVAARARGQVAALVRRGDATVEHLARALAMSRRTLERALAAEGTSAKALFDEARRELALAWLPHATVDEVASRLGYSDARAFARAFRRWTGRSPRPRSRGRTVTRSR